MTTDRTRLLCDDAIEAARWTRLRLRAKEDPMDRPVCPHDRQPLFCDTCEPLPPEVPPPPSLRGEPIASAAAKGATTAALDRLLTRLAWLFVLLGCLWFAGRAAIS